MAAKKQTIASNKTFWRLLIFSFLIVSSLHTISLPRLFKRKRALLESNMPGIEWATDKNVIQWVVATGPAH